MKDKMSIVRNLLIQGLCFLILVLFCLFYDQVDTALISMFLAGGFIGMAINHSVMEQNYD